MDIATTTTKTATIAPIMTAPAWNTPQAVIRDFRCYMRRRVDLDFADVLTPKQRRIVRDLANRIIR